MNPDLSAIINKTFLSRPHVQNGSSGRLCLSQTLGDQADEGSVSTEASTAVKSEKGDVAYGILTLKASALKGHVSLTLMFMTMSQGDGGVLTCFWKERRMDSGHLRSHRCIYCNRRAEISNMNDLPSESTEWTRGPWGPGLRKSHQPERGGEPGQEAEME